MKIVLSVTAKEGDCEVERYASIESEHPTLSEIPRITAILFEMIEKVPVAQLDK